MHPEAGERRSRRPFALRDLVLMMGKDQVDTAGVDVDRRLAQKAHCHRRALQVPPRAARRIDDIPGRLARLGRLPQHEVPGIVLGVAVRVHARARLHALVVEVRQLAVIGERRDLEVDRAVAAIGVPFLLEGGNEISHRPEVHFVGRARRLLDVFEPERPRVLAKERDELVGIGAKVHTGVLGAGNRPVVHVGEVHHLADGVAEEISKRSPQHVDADERPEVADVSAGVHRQPARVHPDRVSRTGRKGLLGPGECVVEAHAHVLEMECEICQTWPPRDDTRIFKVRPRTENWRSHRRAPPASAASACSRAPASSGTSSREHPT